MDSLGIFYDVSLKKSNDLMNVFEEALSKTNNLMETMDNFNSHKIQDKNIFNDEQEKNNNNSIKPRKLHKLKTYNQKKFNKFQLKPIKNNNKYFKLREPYNYQKEYENNLINQIEQLFNPNYTNNNSKDNVGMLSFLSPLINSNLDKRNKEFYNKKINKRQTNLNINNKEMYNNKSSKNINNNYTMKKISEKRRKKTKEKSPIDNEKDKIPEINRPINRAKTNAIKEIYFKSNKGENKSNVDLLINKLKKKYS